MAFSHCHSVKTLLLTVTSTAISTVNLFPWLNFKALHLMSSKILLNLQSADKHMSIIYFFLKMCLENSQDTEVKGSLLPWSRHPGSHYRTCAFCLCTQCCLISPEQVYVQEVYVQVFSERFSSLHGRKFSPIMTTQVPWVVYGRFMFVLYFICLGLFYV